MGLPIDVAGFNKFVDKLTKKGEFNGMNFYVYEHLLQCFNFGRECERKKIVEENEKNDITPLRKMREECGISVEDAAFIADWSKDVFEEIENGTINTDMFQYSTFRGLAILYRKTEKEISDAFLEGKNRWENS